MIEIIYCLMWADGLIKLNRKAFRVAVSQSRAQEWGLPDVSSNLVRPAGCVLRCQSSAAHGCRQALRIHSMT